MWGALLGGVGAALCLVPLFNLLGFEFAFALALVASRSYARAAH
jgi:hypothetical protein